MLRSKKPQKVNQREENKFPYFNQNPKSEIPKLKGIAVCRLESFIIMNEEEIKRRLSNFEDNFTERKTQAVGSGGFTPPIVAFANSVTQDHPGILFIGVRNNGELEDIGNGDSLQKTIAEICRDKCYPSIDFQTQIVTEKGKSFLAVIIPESKNRPHFAGPAYIRNGSKTEVASNKMFEELILARNDKCRRILKMRERPGVPVVVVGKRFGEPVKLSPIDRVNLICKVIDCSPDYVTFQKVNSDGKIYCEQIEDVHIVFDGISKSEELLVQEKS